MTTAALDTHESHDDHGPAKGIKRWLFTTNHKDIGTLYLVLSLTMFFIGGTMALVIRSELMVPGLQFVHPEFFNSMTTMHALVMVFGAVMPAFVGLANWMIPMMIGAPDMALPRMNNWSFWILPVAFGLLVATLFMPGGAPASERTAPECRHCVPLHVAGPLPASIDGGPVGAEGRRVDRVGEGLAGRSARVPPEHRTLPPRRHEIGRATLDEFLSDHRQRGKDALRLP